METPEGAPTSADNIGEYDAKTALKRLETAIAYGGPISIARACEMAGIPLPESEGFTENVAQLVKFVFEEKDAEGKNVVEEQPIFRASPDLDTAPEPTEFGFSYSVQRREEILKENQGINDEYKQAEDDMLQREIEKNIRHLMQPPQTVDA